MREPPMKYADACDVAKHFTLATEVAYIHFHAHFLHVWLSRTITVLHKKQTLKPLLSEEVKCTTHVAKPPLFFFLRCRQGLAKGRKRGVSRRDLRIPEVPENHCSRGNQIHL